MQIDRITIRNFRCFAERTLRLNPSFNLLVGENGTGKTAVLEALSVAAGSWFLGIRGYGERHLRRDDARLVAHQSGPEWSFEPVYPVEVEAEGEVEGEPIEWKRTLVTPRGRTTSYGATEIKRIAAQADARVRDGDPVILPLVAYYGTGRLWLQPRARSAGMGESRKQELSRFEGYRDAIDPRCSPRNLVRWIQRQDYAAYQERRESDLYRVVKRAIVAMVEHAADLRYDPRREEVVLFFKDRDPQPFDNLSDGQRNILALAGDIAVRMARLNPHLGDGVLEHTPGVVLIDELDLHLHPTWQRHLVEDLRTGFPRIQFIATSHSPFVIQTLHEGELIILDEDRQPVADPSVLGIEEISEGLMGVEQPEVSPRYVEMKEAAREYLSALDSAAVREVPLKPYGQRSRKAPEPFSDDPAFQAFLEMERLARLGE